MSPNQDRLFRVFGQALLCASLRAGAPGWRRIAPGQSSQIRFLPVICLFLSYVAWNNHLRSSTELDGFEEIHLRVNGWLHFRQPCNGILISDQGSVSYAAPALTGGDSVNQSVAARRAALPDSLRQPPEDGQEANNGARLLYGLNVC